MSSAPDHLYEDGNTTGYRRTQTKSILKNRENMTMPNPSMPVRHLDTASRLANRRVSFANKVKLHQIGFVPSVDNDLVEGNSSEDQPQDSSDDEDINISELENEASSLVANLRTLPHDNSSGDEDLPQSENVMGRGIEDDQTMEFTGLNTRSQEQEMDFTDQVNVKSIAEPSSPFEEVPKQGHDEVDEKEDNNGNTMEVTMEFTKSVSSYAVLTNNHNNGSTLEEETPGIPSAEVHEDVQESTMDFTKLFNEVSHQESYSFAESARLTINAVSNGQADQDQNDLEDNATMQLTQQLDPVVQSDVQPAKSDIEKENHEENGATGKTEKVSEHDTARAAEEVVSDDDGDAGDPSMEQTMQLTTQISAQVTTAETITPTEQQESPVAEAAARSENETEKEPEEDMEGEGEAIEGEAIEDEEQGIQEDIENHRATDPKTPPPSHSDSIITQETTEKMTSLGSPEQQPTGLASALHSPKASPRPSKDASNNTEAQPAEPASNGVLLGEQMEATEPTRDLEEALPEQLSSPIDDSLFNDPLDGASEEEPEDELDYPNKKEKKPPVTPPGEEEHAPEPSQPMELTQSRSEIQSITVFSQPVVKRLSESFEEPVSKRPHVSTLDVPLAETSTLSADGLDEDYDDPDYEPVTLSAFLNDIGVKFYDDLEIATDTANRYSLSMLDHKANFTQEDYYKGNVNLPSLEVLELSCKELTQKIQQGKKLFETISEQASGDNPLLFRSFYQSSYYDQISMKSQFHQLKEYTRQQAKQVWYEWRTQLMQNVLEVQQGNLEILQADKSILEESLASLEETQAAVNEELDQLKLDIAAFKEIKASYSDLNADQLKTIKSQLMDLNKKLLDNRELIVEKETALSQIQKELEKVNTDIKERQESLSDAENQFNRTKMFNESDIVKLEKEVEKLQSDVGLKYVSGVGTDVVVLEFNNCITIKIQHQDGSPKTVEFVFKETKATSLNFHELAPLAITSLPNKSLTPEENIAELIKAWHKVEQIDADLYKLSLKHPLKLFVEKRGFTAAFTVFSFASGAETAYTLRFLDQAIMNYPDRLTVAATKGRRSKSQITKVPKFNGISKELATKLQAHTYD